MTKPRTMMIALAALMIALTTVLTMLVRVPVPGTQGYISFCDVAVNFGALAFGPLVGLVAGGIGAALADILGGYAQFALLSFLAHGLQGLAVGVLSRGKGWGGLIVAWGVGAVAMVAVYFLGEWLVLGMGWEAALAEVPFNLVQVVVGGVVGIPLYRAVLLAYPPLAQMGRPRTWREE